MAEHDAKKQADEARRKLKEENDAREKARQQSAKDAGGVKPTPTQEENDLAAMGVPVLEKEDDGSGPDPNPALLGQKESKPAQHQQRSGYQTREASPKA